MFRFHSLLHAASSPQGWDDDYFYGLQYGHNDLGEKHLWRILNWWIEQKSSL